MSDNDHGNGMRPKLNPVEVAQMQKQHADFLWCLNHSDLAKQYAEQVVVVHERQVIGSGATFEEARTDAVRRWEEKGGPFPADRDLLMFMMPPMVYLEVYPPYRL